MSALIPLNLGLILMAWVWTKAEAATLTEQFEKTCSLKPGGGVDLQNVNGTVTVEAWDQDQVRIEAEKKVEGDGDKAREVMELLQIEASETAGGLRIVTRLPKRDGSLREWLSGEGLHMRVDYKIRVPRDARLGIANINGQLTVTGTQGQADLETTSGGILVERAGGEIEIRTTNGNIEVTRSAGVVQASTTNGSIDVELDALPEAAPLSFSTLSGGITLRVPGNAGMTLDAATLNGRVSSDFEVTSGRPGRSRLEGEVNGGGGKVKLRTTNGSIRIVAG